MLRRALTHQRQRVVEGRGGVERGQLELHLAGLDLGQVEHVVEQGQQVPAGVADVAEVVLLPFVQVAEHPLQQDLGEPDHRVQRGAQLVRHARQELRLVLAGDGQLETLAGQLLVEPGIGQGDGGLAGERRQQVAHLVVEDARLPAPHHERPDHPVGAAQRHGDQRAPPVGVEDLQVRVPVDRLEVLDLERRRRVGALADPGLVGVDPRAPQLVQGRLARPVRGTHPEQPGRLVVLHQRATVGLGQLHRVADDRGEDLLDIQGRADDLADRGERLELVDLAGRAPWSAGRYGPPGRPGSRTSPAPTRSARRTAPPRSATPTARRRRRRRSASAHP